MLPKLALFAKSMCIERTASLAVLLLLLPTHVWAQATVSTGSISGTVNDPSGAAVAGATVTITNTGTGSSTTSSTNNFGYYNSGLVLPGTYTISVTAKGFQKTETRAVAQVGTATTANIKLSLGSENQTVNVEGETVAVNTEQSSVQGVLTAQQIDTLPVNGRNFLDLAQLEPGVQIQDGTNFDPIKAGYESISFGGRFGRTARIQVDGVDMSDETVGTTTGGLPQSAIQEFQLAQSTMDLSNDLSSSGVVNVTTRSGTNAFHGMAFGDFRDSTVGASLPHPAGLPATYQRSQFGGRIGGAFIQDKLFFFADSENTIQHQFTPVQYDAPFTPFSGGYQAPFKENDVIGRVDFKGPHGVNYFYRYSYSQIKAIVTFNPDSLQPYNNKNYVRQHVIGADFNSGSFSHSVRYAYLKFQNEITDAVIGSGLPLSDFPGNGLYVAIVPLVSGPSTGPNPLAPQQTPQQNNQVKYDGSKTWGRHVLRYGISYNHIQGGGFASFFKLAPQVLYDSSATPIGNFCTNGICGAANPLNYPVAFITMGNGQGFSTEKPALGFPAGGLGPDNRLGLYVSDNFKWRPNFTINIGVRYDRDTGRTDSDLPPIPQLDNLTPAFPNLGNRIPNPNLNFAPNFGIAWDPWNNGKTAIRAGIGLYYENVIYNNVLFDRPPRLPNGAFLQFPAVCSNGAPVVPIAGYPNLNATPAMCSGAIGAEAVAIAQLQQQIQAQTPFNLNAPNPAYVVDTLDAGANFPGGMFAPNYRTPRSLQMNAGIQRELKPGLVFSVDYVRNVTTQLLVDEDLNQSGNVQYFNSAAANYAVNVTNASFGCPPGAAGVQCAITAGATIGSYSANGLDSQVDVGGTCSSNPFGCAFGGLNPKVQSLYFNVPASRSGYNAADFKLTQQVANPMKGVKNINLTASYSLGSFKNCGGQAPGGVGSNDQDFVLNTMDNNNPCIYYGNSLLDRTSQLSFGIVANIPLNFQLGIISHFDSPLSASLVSANAGPSPGQIYQTDFTGDGTIDDLLPGTKLGQFGRGTPASYLNTIIGNYNAVYANNPTPAGDKLIGTGLFNLGELQSLGAVAPTIPLAPANEVGLGWLRTFDFKLSWIGNVPLGDHIIQIQPSVGFFNLFNFSNFDLPPNVLSGVLNGSPGSINGTSPADRISNRVGIGTGVYGLGAPRSIEFGLQISF